MIVKTKVNIPHVRNDLVDRSRLMRLLDEGRGAKLTQLSAPAGYGKTTLLSEWARRNSSLIAWVSLDLHDNDWIAFWSCVIASIRERISGYGQTVWPLLEKGPSASSASPEPAIAAMLNELHPLSGELAIVLDDYHLIELATIHNSMSYLLEHLPSHIHLYIASRAELPILTARLLVNGELKRITMQDLRLQPEEGFAFFRQATDLSLSREQVNKLYEQTEGWISGLQLAAFMLKRSGNLTESIRQFSGHQHHISDYLLEEVFRHQPEEMQVFLLRTSILSRLNRSICHAVTGHENCQDQLMKLEQSHLFIVPLDDERHWYRYHHLLSDFLQRIFAQTSPKEWAQAHTCAAHWLENEGSYVEAAEHYLAGRQYDDVIRLIENNLHALLQKKLAALSKWILQLPAQFVSKKPMVEMFFLLVLIGIGQWEKASTLIAEARIRYELLRERMDKAEWNRVMGNIYFLSATVCYFQKDLERISEYFELMERFTPEGSFLQNIGSNKYNSGFREFEDHLAIVNDFQSAAAYLLKWITRWERRKTHPFVARLYASYSKLLYEWNRLEEAEHYIRQALSRADITSNTRSLTQIYMSASQIQQALGNPTYAAELLEQLKLRIDSPDYELFTRQIEAEQACLAVRQGNIEYGLQWLQRCGMAYSDELTLGSVPEYFAFAKVLANCGREEHALHLFERLYELLTKEDRLRDRIKILILQSVTLHRIGRTDEAFARLNIALRLAEPAGFVRSFADEGFRMSGLLKAYLRASEKVRTDNDVRITLSYVQCLLQALNDETENLPLPAESGTVATSRVKVSCFGRFKVMDGRGAGGEVRWRTAKAEELMAYLIHHKGEAVDKYRILDALWGSDSVKTGNYFYKIAHLLRKHLDSIGLKGILQNNRGYYSIDVSRLDCDYLVFETWMANRTPVNADNLRASEEIAKLYAGRYLERNDYAWAEPARQSSENHYIELQMDISDCYLNKQSYSPAITILKKTLKLAPWNEEVHSRLIRAYLSNNDRISALKQYDSLKRTLFAEFRLEPSDEVKGLLHLKQTRR